MMHQPLRCVVASEKPLALVWHNDVWVNCHFIYSKLYAHFLVLSYKDIIQTLVYKTSHVIRNLDCAARNLKSVLAFTNCGQVIDVGLAVRVAIVVHRVDEILLINLDYNNPIFDPQAVAAN
jgi:hypothetical protein